MHRRIRYNDDAQVLRCEYWWDVSKGAANDVKLEVLDRDGDTLETETSCTEIAGDTLASAVSSGASTFTLTTGKTYVSGDRVLLAGTRPEVVELESYASATKIATLKNPCRYDHAASSAVNSWFCTYILDTSTVATWEEGLLCTLKWSALSATGALIADILYETGQVLTAAFDIPALDSYFRQVYPNEYRAIEEDFSDLTELARDKLGALVSARGRNLETLREPRMLREPLIHMIAWFAALRGSDAGADNAERAWAAATTSFESIAAAGDLWFDQDQDEAQDEDEEVASLEYVAIGPGRVGGF